MLSILQSIHPKYCELIASGKKTIEVRKTKPRIQPPFKVYIYETKTGYVSRSYENDILVPVKYGKVIGEYVCDEIQEVTMDDYGCYNISGDDLKQACLSYDKLRKYGKGKTIYLWHISNLKIYDKPKELSEFDSSNVKCPYNDNGECEYHTHCYYDGKRNSCGSRLSRAPQSWCYVEDLSPMVSREGFMFC